MVYAVHCSKTDAGMIVRVIPMVPFMMEDINTNVIKRLLVCIVQLYKQAFAVRDSAGRNEGGGGRDGGYGFSLSFSRFSLCQRSKSLKKMYRRCGRYIILLLYMTSAYYIYLRLYYQGYCQLSLVCSAADFAGSEAESL